MWNIFYIYVDSPLFNAMQQCVLLYVPVLLNPSWNDIHANVMLMPGVPAVS